MGRRNLWELFLGVFSVQAKIYFEDYFDIYGL